MTLYITQEGDMLDDIAFKFYQDEAMISVLLDANPGLIDQAVILPHGIDIQLVDIPAIPVQNTIKSIWS